VLGETEVVGETDVVGVGVGFAVCVPLLLEAKTIIKPIIKTAIIPTVIFVRISVIRD
jgi:hypothetical protein